MVTIAPGAVCSHNAFYPDEDGDLRCINCGRPPIGTTIPEPKPDRKPKNTRSEIGRALVARLGIEHMAKIGKLGAEATNAKFTHAERQERMSVRGFMGAVQTNLMYADKKSEWGRKGGRTRKLTLAEVKAAQTEIKSERRARKIG